MKKNNEVLFEEIPGNGGNVGLITLNRPQALNALTSDMCYAIDERLTQWGSDSKIKAVVIRGEGDRAFCAGGDLRYVYEQGKSGIKKSRQFFWHEYRMNYRIHHFPKPYIALLDGITMGGGVGISVHGTHRVATEQLVFAMPETGIGFFPDVGGSYFLPRFTGKTGFYIALTGARLHVADACYMGVVDHIVSRKEFNNLIDALADARFSNDVNMQVSDIINVYSLSTDQLENEKSEILEHRSEINQCFAQDTVEDILVALEKTNNEWCKQTSHTIAHKSPTSLKVTFKELQMGARMDFDNCLRMEYRIALRFLKTHDFYEGIRAAIIEKDQKPHWIPKALEAVKTNEINEFFAPIDHELNFI